MNLWEQMHFTLRKGIKNIQRIETASSLRLFTGYGSQDDICKNMESVQR